MIRKKLCLEVATQSWPLLKLAYWAKKEASISEWLKISSHLGDFPFWDIEKVSFDSAYIANYFFFYIYYFSFIIYSRNKLSFFPKKCILSLFCHFDLHSFVKTCTCEVILIGVFIIIALPILFPFYTKFFKNLKFFLKTW